MLAKIPTEMFHRRVARKTFVNTRHQERNGLSEMTKYDLQSRKCVKCTTEHEPHGLSSGLKRESPRGPHELWMGFRIVSEIGVHDGRMRVRWMQIDRYIKVFRTR